MKNRHAAVRALILATIPCFAGAELHAADLIVKTSGAPYSQISDAIAAARVGDRIFVSAGDYRGFTASIGVTILGETGTTCGPVRVQSLKAGQTFAMSGVSFVGSASFTPLILRDCLGHVVLENCHSATVANESLIERCVDVRLETCTLHHSLRVRKSTVALNSSAVLASPTALEQWRGMIASDSEVFLAESVVSGSTQMTFVLGLPAIESTNSRFYVNGQSLLVAGGTTSVFLGKVDVVVGTGSITYAPEVVFQSPSGGRKVVGLTEKVLRTPLLHAGVARIDRLHGVVLRFDQGAFGVVLLGTPIIPVALPIFRGHVAHRSQIPFFATTFPAGEFRASVQIPNDRRLLGFALAWQAIAGDNARGYFLSNASTRIVSDR